MNRISCRRLFARRVLPLFWLALLSPLSAAPPQSRLRDFFVELWRYAYTGVAYEDGVEQFGGLSRIPADIMARAHWSEDGRPCRLIDKLMPDCKGLFDTTVAYDPASDSGRWFVRVSFAGGDDFIVTRPSVWEAVLPELADIAAADSGYDGTDAEEDTESGAPPGELVLESSGGADSEASTDGAKPFGGASEDSESEAAGRDLESPDGGGNDSEESGDGIPIAVPPPEEESVAERRLRNSERLLRLYSFGDEFLYVGNSDGGDRVVVRSDGRRGVRTYFDDAMRMVRRERWDLSGGMEAELSVVERYRYGSSSIPVSAVILEGDERRVLRYDEAGRLSECRIYVRPEDAPEGGRRPAGVFQDGRVLRSLTRWQYASSGRLRETYYEEYRYEKGIFSRPASVHTRRDVYEYKIEGGAPDYFYYEDGVIRMQTVYSAADSYITTLYFDGGFVVESYYAGGRHTKDLYYLDGALRRRRIYDE